MSVNKVILIGNVGKDPDVRYLDAGVAVATFSLATTERSYTLQNGTQVPERTEWHNIVLWRGLAQTAEKYVHKGDKLYIEGKIRSRSYDDQNGIKRTIVEIFADSMEMLTPRNVSQQSGAANQVASVSTASRQVSAQTSPQQQQSEHGLTDDLPF
ncbi:single-stranded DNA-binding protein [Phocaeicola sp.]|uniref:single-stranded DNA-binding protein n=1 Tax=Phocaeicola sp. TaxID=2773926 RepID=UPI0023C3AF06|nr:single-stranded DNA-binding protein [Phocaeicola sp.]MDE5676912.1 single-stranded DNA-binding protein [Phocaeicola sp.]